MMDQQTGASSDMKCRCILGVVFTLCDLILVTIHVQGAPAGEGFCAFKCSEISRSLVLLESCGIKNDIRNRFLSS